jgi:hypothetical protein
MRRKIIECKGKDRVHGQQRDPELAEQMERLVTLVENYNEGAFRPFTQRPLFINSLLVLAAMAVDATDNLSLVLRLFI